MPLLHDPHFLAAAVCAVTLLGISKGGFVGLGVSAVPLLSLYIPPPQAAAILLPILLAQDAVSVWVYHRDFSAWNLKVMLVGAAFGMVLSTLVAASLSNDVVKLAVGLIAVLFVTTRLAAIVSRRPCRNKAGSPRVLCYERQPCRCSTIRISSPPPSAR